MFGKKNKDINPLEEDVFKLGGEEEQVKNKEDIIENNNKEGLIEVEDTLEEIENEKNTDEKIKKNQNNSEDIELFNETDTLLDESKEKKKGFFPKIFGKKKKNIKSIKEDNGIIKKDNEVGSNIFDDFDINSELGKEVNYIKKEINKDSYDYLIGTAVFFKYINLVIILIGIIMFSYVSIQNNEKLNNNSLLDPICSIILGDKIENTKGLCSSLGYIEKQTKNELVKLNKYTFKEEIGRLAQVYKIENFLNSKEVIFLLEKGDSRLRPLNILSLFDDLKNKFEPLLKSKISCFNLSITDKSILTASCYSYSTGWEGNGVLGFNGDINAKKNVAGTSISLASSFLNYLEKQDSELSLLEKQKIFSIESIADTSSAYTKRTAFSIKMKYSSKSNLSF